MAERHMDKGPVFWSLVSWGGALVGALLIGFLIASLSGEGAPTGLVFGGVAFVVLIAVLSFMLGPKADDRPVVGHEEHHHRVTAPEPVAAAPVSEPQPAAPIAEPVAPVTAPAATVHTPPPDPASNPISERVRSAARAAGGAARALGEPVAAPAAGGDSGRPARLDGPREGGADDLKKIKGVGPKLEELLHSMGFYHFDQIAAWTSAELAWVDENLEGFHGRASRDDWTGQAKVLASGGETEFSQRVDKGEVY